MPSKTADISKAVEKETQRLGEEIWEHIPHRRPSMFERRWWDDRILDWAMEDESVQDSDVSFRRCSADVAGPRIGHSPLAGIF